MDYGDIVVAVATLLNMFRHIYEARVSCNVSSMEIVHHVKSKDSKRLSFTKSYFNVSFKF